MGANSKIEWTHHTFNPWIGCAKVSAGCKNCYAENLMDHRYGRVQWGVNGTRSKTGADNWRKPMQWDKAAKALGERHRVFCASLADVFEDRPDLVEWRLELFTLIDATPHLDWLLLTKRPENIMKMWPDYMGMPIRRLNVWLGTSTEDQAAADMRIPELLKAGFLSRFTFLSCEPLLGPVDLQLQGRNLGIISRGEEVNWVIAGGESGAGARRMEPEWAMSLRDQCNEGGVPFLFKQWGEYDVNGSKVGKHAAGRLLDGIEHNEFPCVSDSSGPKGSASSRTEPANSATA